MFAEGILFLKKVMVSRLVDKARAYYAKVMELPDSPKKIARGIALGLSFDFLPIPVISIPVSYLVARLIRCNPVATVATVIFFKLAVPFFFTLNIIVGKVFLGNIPGPTIEVSGATTLAPYLEKIVEHGFPFLLGSVINATVVWFAVYTLLMYLHKKKWRDQGA